MYGMAVRSLRINVPDSYSRGAVPVSPPFPVPEGSWGERAGFFYSLTLAVLIATVPFSGLLFMGSLLGPSLLGPGKV